MIKTKKFIPGKTYIPASGKVFDKAEINNAIAAVRDCWWTEGRFTRQFETDFKKYLGMKYVTLTNSGSSANLLAVAALTAEIFAERKLESGDEFITTPVSFPTTVNPGIIYGLKPVFVDVDLNTLNANPDQVEKAITDKTKLIILAHTLGKPFNLDKIIRLSKKKHIWLIEDCCDALGTKYRHQLVGSFADLATFSFYPAHQITMGEGGAIATNNPLIYKTIRQFRDWGRDCWCPTGEDNTCKKRFKWQLGELPPGYDHKYTYSQIGYNLKLTDMQAAIGLAQLKKLPDFIRKRKENYHNYYCFFKNYRNYFYLIEKGDNDDPCWFGFPIIVRKNAPFTRNQLTEYLENHKIGTRNVFSGNLLRHPGYLKINKRVIGSMKNADIIMNNAFWLGVYPGIDKSQIDYIQTTLSHFLKKY